MIENAESAVVRWLKREDEAAWRRMWSDFVSIDIEPCPQEATDFVWTSSLDDGNAMRMLIAADAEDRAIGFLLYVTFAYSRTARPVCYLLDFYAEPKWRRKGVGLALIDRLRNVGTEHGWMKAFWMTQSDNHQAKRLYDQFGKQSTLVRYDMMLNPYLRGEPK